MMTNLQETMRGSIEDQLLDRFRKAAQGPQGLFSYPTGRAGLRGLGYAEEALNSLPEAVQEFYCGVGNPFAAGQPKAGEQVLDVGCGAGVDALIAAHFVGPGGRVVGLEFSPEMRQRAQASAEAVGLGAVVFQQGGAEQLPFADESFDLLLSNGVYNLVLRKRQALAEAFRVLRPGGRLQVADQILDGDVPAQPQPLSAGDWAR